MRLCKVSGCGRPQHGRGKCTYHRRVEREEEAAAAIASDACDCGEPAAIDGACQRCAWLDGSGAAEADVIAELRGGASDIVSIA